LVVFLPIIFTVARRFGGSLLKYALPTAASFATMHAVVPPHPGPVAAAAALEGDIGMTLLMGVPIAVVGWFLGGYLVSQFLASRFHVDIPTVLFGRENDGTPAGEATEGETGGD